MRSAGARGRGGAAVGARWGREGARPGGGAWAGLPGGPVCRCVPGCQGWWECGGALRQNRLNFQNIVLMYLNILS